MNESCCFLCSVLFASFLQLELKTEFLTLSVQLMRILLKIKGKGALKPTTMFQRPTGTRNLRVSPQRHAELNQTAVLALLRNHRTLTGWCRSARVLPDACCRVSMVTRRPLLRSGSGLQVPVVLQFSADPDGKQQAAVLHPRRGVRSRHRGRPVGVLPGEGVRPEPAGGPLPR